MSVFFYIPMALFVLLHFACAIIASRLIADLQGSPIAAEIQAQVEGQRNWQGFSVFGYHPFNDGVWAALFERTASLPETLRPRARLLRMLRYWQIAAFAVGILCFVLTMFADGVSF